MPKEIVQADKAPRPVMRSLKTRIMAVAALALLFHLPLHGVVKSVTCEGFQKLTDAEKQALARRYVRKVGKYWQVSLDTYLVRTDVSSDYALGTAVKMDEFYRRFTSVFIGRFRINARPELYAIKTKAAYAAAITKWYDGRMSPPAWSTGLFAVYGHKYALFGCAESGEDHLYEILFHEGTHQLLHFYIGTDFPRWFDEGVATNFEGWDISLSAERNIYEEIWRSRYVPYLYGIIRGKVEGVKKPDLIKLMNSTDSDWVNTANPMPLYAQAWSFVNFILSYGRVGEQYFNRMITAFRAGKDPLKVLPLRERVTLASQWDNYLNSVIAPHCEFSLPIVRLLNTGKKEAADKLLDKGLSNHPKNTELLFFKGARALRDGNARQALKILKPLEKQYPRHPLLFRTLGIAAVKVGDMRNRRKWLRKALAEDYKDEEVKKLLGRK